MSACAYLVILDDQDRSYDSERPWTATVHVQEPDSKDPHVYRESLQFEDEPIVVGLGATPEEAWRDALVDLERLS